ISRPRALAADFTSVTLAALPASDCRVPALATKNASQLRRAKAWPTPDEPAFIISGRVPPNGFGQARAALRCRNSPSKSKVSSRVQACLTTSNPFLGGGGGGGRWRAARRPA